MIASLLSRLTRHAKAITEAPATVTLPTPWIYTSVPFASAQYKNCVSTQRHSAEGRICKKQGGGGGLRQSTPEQKSGKGLHELIGDSGYGYMDNVMDTTASSSLQPHPVMLRPSSLSPDSHHPPSATQPPVPPFGVSRPASAAEHTCGAQLQHGTDAQVPICQTMPSKFTQTTHGVRKPTGAKGYHSILPARQTSVLMLRNCPCLLLFLSLHLSQ